MEVLEYQITCILVFLGLAIGYALSYIAPEELKPGKKWFKLARILLLVLIIALMSYSIIFKYNAFGQKSLLSISGLFVLLILFLLMIFALALKKDEMTFSWLAFVLMPYFIIGFQEDIIYVLMIIYGVVEAPITLQVTDKNKIKNFWKSSFKYLAYFLVALVSSSFL